MAHEPKKAVMAAISAAVTSYIRRQEEELAVARSQAAVAAMPAPVAAGSLYGASGRQQMMEMRRLLSLRIGRR
jgi:hypothetical protein